MKRIGIVGGAGPLASSLLLNNVIQECYRQGCTGSGDIPHITLVNYPFDFESCIHSSLCPESYASIAIQKSVDILEQAHADIVAIACNTLHLFVPHVKLDAAQLVDITHTTLHMALEKKLSSLLLLGSSRTMHSELYQKQNIACSIPAENDQIAIKGIIQNVLAGAVLAQDALLLHEIIARHEQTTCCDGVILGCTELSVLAQAHPHQLVHGRKPGVRVLDTIEILAKTLVEKAL